MKLDTPYYQAFRTNCQRIATIRDQLAAYAQKEHRLEQIEKKANQLISAANGQPAFKKVPHYHWATCITVNEGFVHGIPQGRIKKGDIVTIDIGMTYQGTTSDTATTFVIGTPTKKQQDFLHAGRQALANAISQAQPGNKIKDISKALQTTTESYGYNVTRTLTGHGLGKTMHQPPIIPCYVNHGREMNQLIEVGMVLAIESMYMMGDWQLQLSPDNWTLSTADGSLSAMFEEDVLITPEGPQILTQATS